MLMTFLKRLQKLKQEAAENETGIAEKSRWDHANRQQKPGLVWRNRKKISQIIKDYFYLLFFLLIILGFQALRTFYYAGFKERKKPNMIDPF